ncbi:hypothetical protein HanLR1_Chr00c0044g0698831 [Helianthus annuus]|nr:hypothetical protein HanLR1_Chr00c0044g0698831 [Helianthus annuus]
MKPLYLLCVFWYWWSLWAAIFCQLEFFMRDTSFGAEIDYTHIGKSLPSVALTAKIFVSFFVMGGIGMGWFCMLEDSTAGWALAWVGTVNMFCYYWDGPLLGWEGDIRGVWVVKPCSPSGSYLVACFSLFNWSVGNFAVCLPFSYRRLLIGGHFWCWVMCDVLGCMFNPGDIRLDRVGSTSFRCLPPCPHSSTPETMLGYRNFGVGLVLFCSWEWVLGWVLYWYPGWANVCRWVICWVLRFVMNWAFERWHVHCLWTYECCMHHNRGMDHLLQRWRVTSHPILSNYCRGKTGTKASGLMETLKGRWFDLKVHSRHRGKKALARAWYVFWICLLAIGCIDKRITQGDYSSYLFVFGIKPWVGFDVYPWADGWVIKWFSFIQDRFLPGSIWYTECLAGTLYCGSLMSKSLIWILCEGPGMIGYMAGLMWLIYRDWNRVNWKHHVWRVYRSLDRNARSLLQLLSSEFRGIMVKCPAGVIRVCRKQLGLSVLMHWKAQDVWVLKSCCNSSGKYLLQVCCGSVPLIRVRLNVVGVKTKQGIWRIMHSFGTTWRYNLLKTGLEVAVWAAESLLFVKVWCRISSDMQIRPSYMNIGTRFKIKRHIIVLSNKCTIHVVLEGYWRYNNKIVWLLAWGWESWVRSGQDIYTNSLWRYYCGLNTRHMYFKRNWAHQKTPRFYGSSSCFDSLWIENVRVNARCKRGLLFPCKARFLSIPSVGSMISYFWSPECVLDDVTGGMPPR